MVRVPTKGTVKELITYNLNRYAIGLLVVTLGLWIIGYTEYAVFALLALLLLVVIQNLRFAYNGLSE